MFLFYLRGKSRRGDGSHVLRAQVLRGLGQPLSIRLNGEGYFCNSKTQLPSLFGWSTFLTVPLGLGCVLTHHIDTQTPLGHVNLLGHTQAPRHPVDTHPWTHTLDTPLDTHNPLDIHNPPDTPGHTPPDTHTPWTHPLDTHPPGHPPGHTHNPHGQQAGSLHSPGMLSCYI